MVPVMRSILDLQPLPETPAPESRAADKTIPEKSIPGKPPWAAKRAGGETATSSPFIAQESKQADTRVPDPASKPDAVPKKEARSVPVSEPVDIPESHETAATSGPAAEPETNLPETDHADYELVLGRRQMASCLFAGTVLLAVFTGGAYFAGKTSAQNCTAASASAQNEISPATSAAAATPLPSASIVRESALPSGIEREAIPFVPDTASIASNAGGAGSAAATMAAAAPLMNLPLFVNPQPGALYLQVGAVDKGIATVIAEGLRQHGLNAFVAPGPSEKIFRVLIGPFANQADYKASKAVVDAIDVTAFAKAIQK